MPEGQKVTLQYSEIMQDGKFYRENLRTAAAEFSFISAGDDQVIRPHFTFYGFRYVKVTGMEVTEKNLGVLRLGVCILNWKKPDTWKLPTKSEPADSEYQVESEGQFPGYSNRLSATR